MALRDAIHRAALQNAVLWMSPRDSRSYEHQGWVVNHKWVHRLMRLDNLLCLADAEVRLDHRLGARLAGLYRIWPNRNGAHRSNQLWVADITYIRLDEDSSTWPVFWMPSRGG